MRRLGILAGIVCVLFAQSAEACRFCGYSVCRISYPQVTQQFVTKEKVVPVETIGFQANYTIHFPPPAVGGSTVYGYQQFLQLDPMQAYSLWLNSAARYNESAQYAATKGNSEFNQTAALIIGGQASVAESHYTAQSIKELSTLVAQLKGSGAQRGVIAYERSSDGRFSVSNLPAGELSVAEIVNGKCVRCHGPTRAEKGLRLDDLPNLDKEYERKILHRITTADLNERMPPGGTLSPDEISAFYRASSICGGGRTNGAASSAAQPYYPEPSPPAVIERERPVPVPVPVPVPRDRPKKPPPEPKPEPKQPPVDPKQ